MMMGEFDHHHGSIVEDWISPSPSPIFFSAVLNDDILIENIDNNREDLNNGADDLPKTQRGRGGLAARAGFNALRLNTESMRPSDLSISQVVRSPYLTIPPGLSPTTLLESPVFLSNSLVQPSPTTGKFLFAPSGSNNKNSSFGSDEIKDQFFEDFGSQPFSFKPDADPGSAEENSVEPLSIENSAQPQNGAASHIPQLSNSMMPKTNSIGAASGGAKEDGDVEEVRNGEDDGYNWRKYGQKQVKGSEYPRSYYKCTHSNCLVKKKVERSHEGIITEIIYKGSHNHPEPVVTVPTRRLATGSDDQNSMQSVRDGDSPWSSSQNGGGPENLEANNNSLQAQKSTPLLDSSIAVDGSSTFSNDEDEDDQQQEESETSKRRKVEAYASEMTGPTRAIREPRVVVQTTSEVDILDDGYRWRKYGQKVVKGNPNPRSYYKCTSPNCSVRKHVERASHDLRSVITTYEGKHNHDVPAARNSSHLNNSTTTSTAGSSLQHHHLLHRTEYPLVQNEMSRFDNRPAGGAAAAAATHLGSYGYGYGMNQTTGIGSLGGMGNNNSQGVAAAAAYMGGRQSQMGLMMMMPKGGEAPKLEPIININSNNNNHIDNNNNGSSSIYHEIMNRLPQM